MRGYTVDYHISRLQQGMYSELNEFSSSNEMLGRLSSIPVATADVALETLKTPLRVIEKLAFAVINLLGATFFSSCTLKGAMFNAEGVLCHIALLPVAVVIAPFKLVYKMLDIALDPQNAKTIDYFPYSLQSGDVVKTFSTP